MFSCGKYHRFRTIWTSLAPCSGISITVRRGSYSVPRSTRTSVRPRPVRTSKEPSQKKNGVPGPRFNTASRGCVKRPSDVSTWTLASIGSPVAPSIMWPRKIPIVDSRVGSWHKFRIFFGTGVSQSAEASSRDVKRGSACQTHKNQMVSVFQAEVSRQSHTRSNRIYAVDKSINSEYISNGGAVRMYLGAWFTGEGCEWNSASTCVR